MKYMSISWAKRALLVTTITVMLVAVPLTAQTQYQVTDLGTLGGDFSESWAINLQGDVVGPSLTTNDEFFRGFVWHKGQMHDLGTLGGPFSFATGVNELGTIVGFAETKQTTGGNPLYCFSDYQCRGFVSDHGKKPRDLGSLPHGKNGQATWVNLFGQIAGFADISTDVDPVNGGPDYHATMWTNGRIHDLGTLGGPISFANSMNENGQVFGQSQFDSVVDPFYGRPDFHAFVWKGGHMIDLMPNGGLGGNESGASIGNNRGQIVGFATLAGEEHLHAALWDRQVLKDLGTIGDDPDSFANFITDARLVVGDSGDATTGDFRAALWRNGTAIDLNDLVSGDCDCYLVVALGMNPCGQIAVSGVVLSTGEFHAFLMTPQHNDARSAVHRSRDKAMELSPAVRRMMRDRVRRLRGDLRQ